MVIEKNKYSLSVGIVTYNRPDSLKRTLESLKLQGIQPDEVLISDDSNKDELIKENKELSLRFGCKYISGPQKGLYANRNFVARNCTGTHIRSMDDDHEFPENHFSDCWIAIENEPETIWVIGEYNPGDINRPLPPPVPGQMHPRGYSYAPDNMDNYYGISCGATIYPRSVVDRNILNSESYKFGILYLEYGARLLKRGYKIKHILNTYVIHHYDHNNRSITSEEIQDGAQVYSMLMFSFFDKPSLSNKIKTLTEITRKILTGKFSLALVKKAFKNYRIERSKFDLNN